MRDVTSDITTLSIATCVQLALETLSEQERLEDEMGQGLARGALLWLLGVPLSVIILIALFTNYI